MIQLIRQERCLIEKIMITFLCFVFEEGMDLLFLGSLVRIGFGILEVGIGRLLVRMGISFGEDADVFGIYVRMRLRFLLVLLELVRGCCYC